MKNVALHNLGCKVNSYEIEVMQQKLSENNNRNQPNKKRRKRYEKYISIYNNIDNDDAGR